MSAHPKRTRPNTLERQVSGRTDCAPAWRLSTRVGSGLGHIPGRTDISGVIGTISDGYSQDSGRMICLISSHPEYVYQHLHLAAQELGIYRDDDRADGDERDYQ